MSYDICKKCGMVYNKDLSIQNKLEDKEYIKNTLKNLNSKKKQQQFEEVQKLKKEYKKITKQNNLLKEDKELLNKLDEDDIKLLNDYVQLKNILYTNDESKLMKFCQEYGLLLDETDDEIIEENSNE